MKVVALVVAAGRGSRMGAKERKPYLMLAGKPILAHTLSEFERCSLIDETVLIVAKNDVEHSGVSILKTFEFKKVSRIIVGGLKRQDSVWEGLKALKNDSELVMVHDGVRPFVSQEVLEKSIHETFSCGATITAVPVKDTIKMVSERKEVLETLDRDKVWMVQTPQTFRLDILKRAFEKAFKEGFYGTDDASLVERIGVKVKVIPGSYENIKITTPEDLVLGEAILQRRAE
jgi:2-C-methyl-D-erythritol 4-phosphate cytidylyltransferase